MSKKHADLKTKMGDRFPYYPPDGSHKTRLSKWENDIAKLNEKKQHIDDQIEATSKYNKWVKVVDWAIIGVDVAWTGFRDRVVNGLDWDDVCENMADEAVAGVGGYLAGGAVEAGLVALSEVPELAPLGSAAGPVGIVAGVLVGAGLSYLEPLHDFFEEVTDWWDTLWW